MRKTARIENRYAENDIDVYAWFVEDSDEDQFTGHAWLGEACSPVTPEYECYDCYGVCEYKECSKKAMVVRGPSRGITETAEVSYCSSVTLTAIYCKQKK